MERVERIGALLRMAGSLWVPRAIHAAAELCIADALADGAASVRDVAARVGADAGALHRLLRALATLGLVEDEDDRFSLTPTGDLLRSDTRDSLRSTVLLMAGPLSYRGWGCLADCVRTGRSAPQLLQGLDDPFEGLSDPDERAVFDRSMAEGTRQIAGAVLLAYDFEGIRSVADVGGGHGALLPPLLRTHPEMAGIVFDRPSCRAGAERVFEKTRIAERARFVEGSFFEDALPRGADAYLLKAILHDWDDARCLEILRRCREAMPDGGRLLVIEMVVPERLGASDADRQIAASDLNMLVSTGGRERTAAEYGRLLEAAGLRLARVVPTIAGVSVIEASPA